MNCPACDHPFSCAVKHPSGFVVWCGYYKCPATIANDGLQTRAAWSQSRQESVERDLAARVEAWLQEQEYLND